MPLSEKHVDVGPCKLDCRADAHQTVVDPNQIAQQGNEQEKHDQQCDHGTTPVNTGQIRSSECRLKSPQSQARPPGTVTFLSVSAGAGRPGTPHMRRSSLRVTRRTASLYMALWPPAAQN